MTLLKYSLPVALACMFCKAPFTAVAVNAEPTRVVGVGSRVFTLPQSEADALEFLYKSMPASDQAMYSPEFHLANVRIALKAREEMPWGKSVPDNVWRHFVLPSRSNNEYLDKFRTNYYDELKERVKGMDMHDAALEVNHWLHEKVTYEPSDARTSAPMATILNSKGRCGEESVLGVAAFRTIGIPARQVYTPRWAHTDDNHAWVEVWVDGKWYFLGACEPEPELNRAWFNAPASRGMLMHTRVFGDYPGPEQIISHNKGITEINVTDNYVPVRESRVKVVNRAGVPVKNVNVAFKIYNYAEFFTAANVKTDANGEAMLKTGKGDMVAWATDGTYFGFAKVSGPQTRLVLDHKIGETFELDMDIVPPAENSIPSSVTDAQVAENYARTVFEDKLRNAYTDTFYGAPRCLLSSEEVKEAFGEKAPKVEEYLRKAKGNWRAIYDFLRFYGDNRTDEALALLGAIAEKDLRDTPARVLVATMNFTEPDTGNPLYMDYVLNPRVDNELLSDYRLSMRPAGKQNVRLTVNDVIKEVSRLKPDNSANAYRVPITPYEVWKTGVCDDHSRDIFFVALCRNNAIPARIDPVSGHCQYNDGKSWVTVNFGNAVPSTAVVPEGKLTATFTPQEYLVNPEYYRHFTISNMDSGMPRLYEFGEDMGESYASLLANGVNLPEGYYLLVTGVRQASGTVNAHMSFFNIKKDDTTAIPLVMRHEAEAIEVIGNIDAEKRYLPEGESKETSILSTTGRGYFIIGILGDNDEPSNHAIEELRLAQPTLEKWGRPILLLGKRRASLDDNKLIKWGADPDGKVTAMLEEVLTYHENVRLPIIAVADSFGRVVFITTGYDTSLSQKLANLLPRL